MKPVKKTLTVALIAVCSCISPVFAQDPTTREYPYLYKSTRAMGMGGAYTAIGGRVDTLFYNPAGLSNIPKDKGWEVNILNLSAEVSEDTVAFFRNLDDATSVGEGDIELQRVNELLAEFRGKNLHARAADFTSFGRSYDAFAFGVGALGSGRLDAIPHQGLGPEGILEVNADLTWGAVGGMSFKVLESLHAGLAVKSLHRETVIHNFTARELVEKQDGMDDFIKDELAKEGNAVGFDAGFIWNLDPESRWRPSMGVSVLNIGDLDFKEAGKIPMTVNAGIAVNPDLWFCRSLLVGVDYVDITNNFLQDKDAGKRLRYGAEVQFCDFWPIEVAVRAGMYQGYPTFGADLRILTFAFSYALYSEELGAFAGQDRNMRHLLTFNFGW